MSATPQAEPTHTDTLALTPHEFFQEVLAGVAAGWCPTDDAARWITNIVIDDSAMRRRLEVIGLLEQFQDCVGGIRPVFESWVSYKLTQIYPPSGTGKHDAGAI